MSPTPLRFRRSILSWYDRRGRHGLPWRGRFDPYRVLVSEFMLQQTGVSTVIPRFHRFLKSFPTLESLAEAKEERVLEEWSGLGYYARARNLRAAARAIRDEHGGMIPRSREAVESLPGVGPYTAGALLSFAHDAPEALVDGNVIRVLSRIYGITGDVKDPATLKTIWALARTLTPPRGARRYNSALMDLGATVCRPSKPDCPACPFRRLCWARRRGREEELPTSGRKGSKKNMILHAGLIRCGGRWALLRRPPRGLYSGLWEFPAVERPSNASSAEVELSLGDLLKTPVRLKRRLPPVAHTLSHREILLHPWLGETSSESGTRWFSADRIRGMAISSLTRKLLDLLPD